MIIFFKKLSVNLFIKLLTFWVLFFILFMKEYERMVPQKSNFLAGILVAHEMDNGFS
jgi:hypothetical protein